MPQSTILNFSIMRSGKNSSQRKRRGSVTVVVALCLTAVLGFAALATDNGLLVAKRNRLQHA